MTAPSSIRACGDTHVPFVPDPLPPVRYYLADQVSFVPGAQTITIRVDRTSDATGVLA